MKIREAIFSKSAAKISDCPRSDLPEFAFIGRSNVGKSSLINRLCNNSKLAKTSATPGKTKLINHFLINGNWFLVDLPGYGFAKTGKQERVLIETLIYDYCMQRENLVCLFILVDSRLTLQAIDREFITWCGTNEIPFSIVFTKSDKMSKNALAKNLRSIEKELMDHLTELPNMFVSSSQTGLGKEEILDFIEFQVKEINTAGK